MIYEPCPLLKKNSDMKTSSPLVNMALIESSCASSAFLSFCANVRDNVDDRMACFSNPKSFFQHLGSSYIPTEKAIQARNLLRENDVHALSIGSSRLKLCDDATEGRTATLCTDRPSLDIFLPGNWAYLLGSQDENSSSVSIEHIFSEHVLEHFEPTQIIQIASTVFMILPPGGVFRIAIPDGYKPSPEYQQYVRAGSTPSGRGQNHMVSWTIDNLCPIFERLGFTIRTREHYDAKGVFFSSSDAYDHDKLLGKVRRSSRYDTRNKPPHKKISASKYKDLRDI